ncbi:MAG: nuclear transport factor 2 family protein [Nitrospira sp.]
MTLFICVPTTAIASEPSNDPESAIRRMVRANAEKDLSTLSRLMAHDADIISYAVAGRKYIGWTELEEGMREEFANSQKIEIPIHELTVWTKGDVAWYAMELDYIRYVADGPALKRTVFPMRETGVLERRNGSWQLLSWHESFRSVQSGGSLASPPAAPSGRSQ